MKQYMYFLLEHAETFIGVRMIHVSGQSLSHTFLFNKMDTIFYTVHEQFYNLTVVIIHSRPCYLQANISW